MWKLILILFIAFILRFYHLGNIPPSLNWDEASVGWNAFSLVKTGTDEYGSHIPISIRSFGDFKPPILTYAVAGSIFLFNLSEFSVRFPSAFAGTLTVLMVFLLTRQLSNNKILAYCTSLLLAISPWHLQFSRIAFEASIALLFFTSAVYFLVLFQKRQSSVFFLLAILLFCLGFYTHHSVRVIFPLFVAGFVVFNYRIFLKKIKLLFISGLLLLVLLFPLAYNAWRFGSLQARFSQTSIFYTPGLPQSDKAFLSSHGPVSGYIEIFAKNYLSHFNFDFLFLTGDKNARHHAPDMGQLLLIQFPLVLLGSYFLFRDKPKWWPIVLWWFLLSPVASALTLEIPHASRSFLFIIPYQIISAYGLVKLSKLFRPLVILTISFNIFYFFHQYFIHLPIEDAAFWQYGYKQVVQKVKKIEDNYPAIYITKSYDQPYIYFLLYGNINTKTKNPGNFSEGFGKYKFVENFNVPSGSLLVLSPSDKVPNVKTIDTVNFPNGSVDFNLTQKL